MAIPNRRRGLVPPPPPKYDPEWENRLRNALDLAFVKADDFTASYPFTAPHYASDGRIELTQISNVTGGPSNVLGSFTKSAPHDEEDDSGDNHWVMRQYGAPSFSGLAYYASPKLLPHSVSEGPNISGFRLDYDNLYPYSSYDDVANALADTSTKICFQAPVSYAGQATLAGGAVDRVDDELLSEATSLWQMSLAELRDGISDYTLGLVPAPFYQYVRDTGGTLMAQESVLGITAPLKAVDAAPDTTLKLAATAIDKYLYSTGVDTWAEGAISAFARTLLDDTTASAVRDTLGASTGVWGLALGGTAADLSATGGTGQVLKQATAGAAITVGTLSASDVGAAPSTRSIATTSPLAGGGDLSADRTLTLAGLSGLGTALYMLRTNAGATAWEYRSPAQILSDIGAAAAAHTHPLAAGATDVTATAAEVNILDGATLTVTELNYVDGVTSAIQGQLDAKQPLDATLTSIAALGTAADRYLYSTGIDTWAEGAITAFGRSLLDDADATAGRNTLGASTGVWGLAVGGTAADLSATGGTGQFLRQNSAGAAVTVSAIAHADLGSGGGGSSKYLREDMSWQTVSAGVTGSGVANQVAYWSGTSALTGDADLVFNGTQLLTSGLFVGALTGTPARALEVLGNQGVVTAYQARFTFNPGGHYTEFGTGYSGSFDIASSVSAARLTHQFYRSKSTYGSCQYVANSATNGWAWTNAAETAYLATLEETNGLAVNTAFNLHVPSGARVHSYSNALWLAGVATTGRIDFVDPAATVVLGGFTGITAATFNMAIGFTPPAARALEVRSTSAQIRISPDTTAFWDAFCATDGSNKWTTGTGLGSTELEATRTITGAVTDGYAGSLILDPGYTAATAQTVTRHNYLDAQDVSVAGAGPAAVTDACLVRFDAAAGTHKATVGATTKTTPGGVDAWIKININGTLYYMPAYLSTTA